MAELAFVRDDAAEFGRCHTFERRALLLRPSRDRRARLAQSLAQEELVEEDFRLPRFEARVVEDVVDDGEQMLLTAADALEVAPVLLAEAATDPEQEQVGISGDGVQWRR